MVKGSNRSADFEREAFTCAVGEYCRTALSIPATARIMVAVSGGADSVALLYVLRELGYTLEVAHFDHVTRGGASTDDAVFVEELARTLNVPFHLECVDVAADATNDSESFEMCARRMRYGFLVRTAKAHGCSHVATGHHADDQAETLLMRILRGTTGHGLVGIPAVRVDEGVRIVRPLLRTRRDDILRYLERIGASYREDVSNRDEAFLRNQIRHTLIPALERDYNPQLVSSLCKLAESQGVEQAWLKASVDRAFADVVVGETVDRAGFRTLPEALRRRVFLKYAWALGVECPHDRVVAGTTFIAEGRTGARFDLGTGVGLINGADVTEVVLETAGDEAGDVVLAAPGVTDAFQRRFVVRSLTLLPDIPLSEYCSPRRQVFDADEAADLRVRRVRTGDRFRPLGLHGSRSLADYLTDLKLSPSERVAQLVLCSGDRVIWVVGRAVSAEAAITARTARVLEVEISDAAC